MKKITLLITSISMLSLITLTGCSSKNESNKQTKDFNKPKASTSISSTQQSSSTIENTKVSSSSITTSTSTPSGESESTQTSSTISQPDSPASSSSQPSMPFVVDLTQYQMPMTFYFKGYNVPNSVAINDANSSSVTFTFKDKTSVTYTAQKVDIPTKVVSIFSAKDNTVREVKVNTQINLINTVSDIHGPLYLFHNRDGGISILTPNYAGNVTQDQRDIMLEVIQ